MRDGALLVRTVSISSEEGAVKYNNCCVTMYENSFGELAPSVILCAKLCGRITSADVYWHTVWGSPLPCDVPFLGGDAFGNTHLNLHT